MGGGNSCRDCCCSRFCPIITSIVFVAIALCFVVFGTVALSDKEDPIVTTAWYYHDADNALRRCPNSLDTYEYKGNFFLWAGLNGLCVQNRVLGVKLARDCYGFSSTRLEEECAQEVEEKYMSDFRKAVCRAKDDYSIMASMTILACIFTTFFLTAICFRLCKDSGRVRITTAITGFIAWSFQLVAVSYFIARNFPGIEDKFLDPNLCPNGDAAMDINYVPSQGWFLFVFAFIICFVCNVVLCITPTP